MYEYVYEYVRKERDKGGKGGPARSPRRTGVQVPASAVDQLRP